MLKKDDPQRGEPGQGDEDDAEEGCHLIGGMQTSFNGFSPRCCSPPRP
jgi:hypothetical protein